MIRYLGKRYDLLMACIARGGLFTCTDMEAHPKTIRSLANDGYLDIVGGHDRHTPYRYRVPERIRQYYARER